MFLIVRDEDVPTVAAAVQAFAVEEGLEPDEGGVRVVVAMGEESVVVSGLEGLDIADADEWAKHLSDVCGTEVIAVEDGEVLVFDAGEQEDEPDVPELDGVDSVEELLARFKVGGEAVTLSFRDPLDERFQVEPLLGVTLSGRVGTEVMSPLGHAFGVTLTGADEVEGCRLEIGGEALALLDVEAIEVDFRTRQRERIALRLVPERTERGLAVVVEGAYLERVDLAPPQLDLSDMFSSMQSIMSATENQQENTLLVAVIARGRAAGAAELVLTASSESVAEGEGAVPVEVHP
jgi:hypothetical protein